MDLLNPGPSQQAQQKILTDQQVAQMHDLAEALQKNALDTHPIYSPWEGAARMADALAGNITQARQADAQRDITGYTEQQTAKMLGIPIPGQPSQSLPSAPQAQSAGGGDVDWNHYADRTFQIESGGDPNAKTGSNRGLGQFGPEEERKYGINDQNRNDPGVQRHALFQEGQGNVAALTAAGLPVNEANLYLLHQQGQGGGIALLKNPGASTTQALAPFYGDGGAKAISGNTYSDAPFHGQDPSKIKAGDFVGYWAHKFNPISPANAASAAPAAGTGAAVLTPEALAAHGQQNAPSFEGRFGNQPQTFDQGGNPLPQGGTPGTFDQRFQPMLPQTSPPPPQPPNPGPIAAPKPPTPAPAPSQESPAAMPHVAVTPRPAGTGQGVPGTMSLQQQHAILNLIGQPATHELGLALAKQYLMPQETNAPTGYKYMGTPGAGYTPSQMPALPTPIPGPEGPYAPKTYLEGSRGGNLTVPGLQGGPTEMLSKSLNDAVTAVQNAAPEHAKKLKEWLKSQGLLTE